MSKDSERIAVERRRLETVLEAIEPAMAVLGVLVREAKAGTPEAKKMRKVHRQLQRARGIVRDALETGERTHWLRDALDKPRD